MGVLVTIGLWFFLTTGLVLTHLSSVTLLTLTFTLVIPVTASACLWQNRIRRDYLDGYIPRRWSRQSLFWILGRATTVGQKVVVFQIAIVGYILSQIVGFFSPTLFSRIGPNGISAAVWLSSVALLLTLAFAGMIATLIGDAVAVYLLTDHAASQGQSGV